MKNRNILFILFCSLLPSKNMCMERERHSSPSQRISPAKAGRDAIIHDPDVAQMLTKSMPAVRKLNLSGTETAGQLSPSHAAPHSPIRKTVSLGPEVLEREEEKLRNLSSAASPRYQFPLEVSELHDWATKYGRYKGSHIGNIARERALAQTYNVDAIDKEGITPLMGAIIKDYHGDNFDRVEFLVGNGARVNRICLLGLDCLQLCKPGSELIRAFLERHAQKEGITFPKERYGPEVAIILDERIYKTLPDSIQNEVARMRGIAENPNATLQEIADYRFFLLKCGLVKKITSTTCCLWQPKQKGSQKQKDQKK